MSFTPKTSDRAAPAVLLLHGQPGSAADWNGVMAALGDRARAIAIDRLGWGATGSAGDLAANAAAALAALDAAQTPRALVVGHSLGAAVALCLAAQAPERVSGLVLVAPAANLASRAPVDRALGLPLLGELIAATGMVSVGLALRPARLRRRLARVAHVPESYLSGAVRTLLRPAAWRACAVEQRAWLRDLPALDARLGEIDIPAVLLTGDEDHVVALHAVRELAHQLPSAELLVRPGAGHLLPQSDSGLVADTIAAQLERV